MPRSLFPVHMLVPALLQVRDLWYQRQQSSNLTTDWSLTSAFPDSSIACGDSVSDASLGPGYCPYRNPVWVFLSDFLALRAALLERMLLFVHELHSPENRAGPSWAEGTQGGGRDRGRRRRRLRRTDSAERSTNCATSLFTNPAPDRLDRPRLLTYATSSAF